MGFKMRHENYYRLLGVDRQASTDEIKRAYRRLIAIYHPDKGVYDERIVLINQAYETLKNPKTRAAYDSQLMWQKTAIGLDKVGRVFEQFKYNIKDNVDFIRQNAKKALKSDELNCDDHHTLTVYPWQAMLGDKVIVSTAYHRLQVFMPAFCDTLTLKIVGAGKPDGRGGFGDLYLHCVVAMPKSLPTDEQKQAWQQLKQSYQTDQ